MSYITAFSRALTQRDKATRERDEAREALRCTEDALQGMTALCAAWTELACARGLVIQRGRSHWDFREEARKREARAIEALVKLGVAREAL